MKTILSILSALAVLALAVPANAQTASGGLTYSGATTLTGLTGGTNNLAVVTTNTVNISIPVPRSESVALYISGRPILSNNVALALVLQKSVDNVTFDSVSPIVVQFTGTTNTLSGAVVNLATNLQIGSVPYLRLHRIGSLEGVAVITNLTVSYGFKR